MPNENAWGPPGRVLRFLARVLRGACKRAAREGRADDRLLIVHETDVRFERMKQARLGSVTPDPRRAAALSETLSRIDLKARFGWPSK